MSEDSPSSRPPSSSPPSRRAAGARPSGEGPISSNRPGYRRERRRRKGSKKETPADSGRMPLVGRGVSWLLLVSGGAVAAALLYLLVVYPASKGPGSGKDVRITIDAGEATSSVVEKLDAAGLVRSSTAFALYTRLTSPRFAPGAHLLTDDASPQEIVHRLERLGAASKARVTIPEGWNRFDIAKRLETLHVATATGFLEATTDAGLLRELGLDGDSAEGFLFPATYELVKDCDPKDVVRRLKSEFDRRFLLLEQNHRLGRANLESTLGWSRKEIVTLASMVEKEAAVDEERPIIASVFLNRLRDPSFKRKVLQCDPTSGYGCLVMRDKIPACAGYSGKITHAINTDPANTYSTYVHEGLPPGPIANPGVKSMQAVLLPASTKFLYFVTRGEGRRHAFSETIEEHNTAVKDLRERSHRDHGER